MAVEELTLDRGSYVSLAGEIEGTYEEIVIKITEWEQTAQAVWFKAEVLVDYNNNGTADRSAGLRIVNFSSIDTNRFGQFEIISEEQAAEIMRENIVEELVEEEMVEELSSRNDSMMDIIRRAAAEATTRIPDQQIQPQEAGADVPREESPYNFSRALAGFSGLNRPSNGLHQEAEANADQRDTNESIGGQIGPISVFSNDPITIAPLEVQAPEPTPEPRQLEVNSMPCISSRGVSENLEQVGNILPLTGPFIKNINEMIPKFSKELFDQIDATVNSVGHKFFLNLDDDSMKTLIHLKMTDAIIHTNLVFEPKSIWTITNATNDNPFDAAFLGAGLWYILSDNPAQNESLYKKDTVVRINKDVSQEMVFTSIDNHNYSLMEVLSDTTVTEETLAGAGTETYKVRNNTSQNDINFSDVFGKQWVQAIEYFVLNGGALDDGLEVLLNTIDTNGTISDEMTHRMQTEVENDLRKAG